MWEKLASYPNTLPTSDRIGGNTESLDRNQGKGLR